jgi:hypothetical protein
MSALLQPTLSIPFVAISELNRQLNYVVRRFAYSCLDVKYEGYCGRRLRAQIFHIQLRRLNLASYFVA